MSNIEVDADIRAMNSARRRPLILGLGIVGGLVLLAELYLLTGAASVKSSLASAGYKDVHVQMNGPFEYGFTATKSGATCGGTVTRTPLSTSREETCFAVK